MRLAGKAAVVTGGGRGIGRAIALALGTEGANVVVASRTQTEIETIATQIEQMGQGSLAVPTDATQLDDLDALAERAKAEFGSIEIWVNNAGGTPPEAYDIPDRISPAVLRPIWEQSEAAWDENARINLKPAFLGLKAVMPYMIEQGSGDVVNIASRAGRQVSSIGLNGYSEMKHAVIALTRNAALQASSHGIRINAVSPRMVDTAGQRRALTAILPKEHWPSMDSPESVAAGVIYLLCDAPKSMTGHSLDLFGVG